MPEVRRKSTWIYSAAPIAILSVCMFLFTSVPSAAATAVAPVSAPFSRGCDPTTVGDPAVQAQIGIYGGGGWSENFTKGIFSMPGPQYARSVGGIASADKLEPWITFGPGTPNATSCIKLKSTVSTTLTFFFTDLSWIPLLQVNCVGENPSAFAQFYLNVSGDLYDFTTGSWVVNAVNHAQAQVASYSMGCNRAGTWVYGPPVQSLGGAIAGTGATTYAVHSGQKYFYFADVSLATSAASTGASSSLAEVADVHATLSWAYCPKC